jgi:hypothetical protein
MSRKSLELPITGMFKAGDAGIGGNVGSRKIKNLALRPGPRLEKRDGFLRDGTITVGSGGAVGCFYRFNDERNARVYLLFGNSHGATRRAGGYRDNVGAWTQFSTATTAAGAVDSTNAFNKVYGIYAATATTNSGSWSWDGTTEAADPFVIKLGGRTIENFQRRLWIGAPTIEVNNLLTGTAGSEIAYQFEDAAAWTSTNMGVSVVGNARQSAPTNATGTLVSATVATTSGAQYVTWRATFRPLSGTITLPLNLSIENAAAATTYASLNIELPTATTNPGFVSYILTAFIPDSIGWRLRIRNGTWDSAGVAIKTGITGTGFVLADSTGVAGDNTNTNASIGHVAVYGRFVPPFMPTVNSATPPTLYYPTRIYGSEPDEPTNFKSTRYYDIVGVPGAINLIRADGDKLYIFKDNAIFVFRGNESAELPLQYIRTVSNFGCVGPKAWTAFEGEQFFIGPNGVYRWQPGSGQNPVELSGEAMREELFNANTVSAPVCEMDESKRQLWCYLQAGKVHIFDLDTKQWFYYTLTGASDAELTITDLAFGKFYGASVAEMFVMMAQSTDIVKLRSGQTQDNITGTSRDVVAEWEVPILNTASPWKELTVEQAGLRHSITASQSASVTEWSVSLDNGSTWAKYNQFDPTVTTAGAVIEERLPLRQTTRRALLKLKHTGLTGPTYFNVIGAFAEADIKDSGDHQKTNPTQVGSSL